MKALLKGVEILDKSKLFLAGVALTVIAGGYCFISDVADSAKDINIKEIVSNEQIDRSLKIFADFENIGKTISDSKILTDEKALSRLENVDDVGTVVRVIDGDTYIILINNTETKVRLIGVDTPESAAPESYRKDNTEEGGEVSEIVKDKIREDDILYIEYDVQKTDNYGRTLAYLYFPDGTMIQEWLLENGYANIATYPPNVKYADRFKELAQTAAENKTGLWNGFFESEEVKYD